MNRAGYHRLSPPRPYYMPYTHSLIAAVAWSGIAAVAYGLVTARALTKSPKPAIWVGAAVISHWILDLIVHRPDLPLYDDAYKVRFGLWNYTLPALLLESAFLFGGLGLYLRSTQGTTFGGRYGMILFGIVIWGVHVLSFFGPPPAGPRRPADQTNPLSNSLAIRFWV